MAAQQTAPETGEHTEEATEAHHPTPRQYVQVAVVLALLTAGEVALSFIEVGPAFLPGLIILMVLKFLLVAGWFMHLRFDTRTYSRLMGTGLVLALSLYAVVVVNMLLGGG